MNALPKKAVSCVTFCGIVWHNLLAFVIFLPCLVVGAVAARSDLLICKCIGCWF